jgi:hypothetical protein
MTVKRRRCVTITRPWYEIAHPHAATAGTAWRAISIGSARAETTSAETPVERVV